MQFVQLSSSYWTPQINNHWLTLITIRFKVSNQVECLQFHVQYLNMCPEQFSYISPLVFTELLCSGPSVDGEHVTLDLVAQLSLQITQLLFQDSERWHDDGLRAQRTARLHIIIEPVQEQCHACGVRFLTGALCFVFCITYSNCKTDKTIKEKLDNSLKGFITSSI